MRTTLKRGIGRGAVNGNGNGNGYAPPGVLTPMVRYQQPPPPRRGFLRGLAHAFLWSIALVLVLVTGAAGGLYLYAHNNLAATNPRSAAVKKAAQKLNAVDPGKPAVALIIGSDHRFTDGKNPARSDTIMLLRTDPALKTISMLSLPRDLAVEIHCPGRATYVDKINAAYSDCGPSGTLDTVRALTGLPVHYLINVNFVGFINVVDKLGGVYIDVDRRYFNNHTGPTGYAKIDLQPGYQRLSGSQALDYVRYRHTDSDLYRNARQQLFIKAIKAQISRLSGLDLGLKFPGVVRAIAQNTEIGRAGGKGVDGNTVKNYAFFLYRLPAGHFFQSKLQNLTDDGSQLHYNPSDITAAVQDFLHPDVTAADRATRAALGLKAKRRRVVPPSAISITVLNGNGVARSAADTSYLLAQRGFHTVTPPAGMNANAPNFNYFRSEVYFDPHQPNSRLAATEVARLFGNATVGSMGPILKAKANGAMLVVIVGQTFHGDLGQPAPAQQPIKHEPPHVTRNPWATLTRLRSIRTRVPFRLEVPTLLDNESKLDWEAPLRLYRVAGNYKAVRLVFNAGVNAEYWGVEETNWQDAPVLSGRTFRHVLGGRTYDFYYSGSHLHMIVLRENGASYWVVNTLSDHLTNETMIAIARGLRPI